jgi:ketosteroid isomerase-like protein
MSRSFLLAATLSLAALTAACQKPATPAAGAAAPAVVDTAKDEAAIKADEVQWTADFKSKDPARISAHYAADATAMLPGAPVMSGLPAIVAGMTEAVKDPAFSLDFTNQTTSVSGDLAYTRGTFTQTASDPKTKQTVTLHGSYVTVWRRQADGSWKALEDIATPAAEPPSAAPPPKAG